MRNISYTIVGGIGASGDSRVLKDTLGVIVLNRSVRQHTHDSLAMLVQAGYKEIIFVESKKDSYLISTLSREFPSIKFLVLHDVVSVGSQINLAVKQMHANTIMVLWSDMGTPLNIDKAQKMLLSYNQHKALLAVAPLLKDHKGIMLPTAQVPAMKTGTPLTVFTVPIRDIVEKTLFPFDYVSLYHRKHFEELGGFNEQILTPFWQKLDFGFRAYLWGYTIEILSSFRIHYQSMPQFENQTADQYYPYFYARNLWFRWTGKGLRFPFLHMLRFAVISGVGLQRTLALFQETKHWLMFHSEKFQMDAYSLVKNWQ